MSRVYKERFNFIRYWSWNYRSLYDRRFVSQAASRDMLCSPRLAHKAPDMLARIIATAGTRLASLSLQSYYAETCTILGIAKISEKSHLRMGPDKWNLYTCEMSIMILTVF